MLNVAQTSHASPVAYYSLSFSLRSESCKHSWMCREVLAVKPLNISRSFFFFLIYSQKLLHIWSNVYFIFFVYIYFILKILTHVYLYLFLFRNLLYPLSHHFYGMCQCARWLEGSCFFACSVRGNLANGCIMWRNAQAVGQAASPVVHSRTARHMEKEGNCLWPNKFGSSAEQTGFRKKKKKKEIEGKNLR